MSQKEKIEKWETQEHKDAVYLARRHEYGICTPRNIGEARRIFEKLAEYDAECAYHLAVLYHHKEPVDVKIAIKWYEAAVQCADRCIPDAFCELGYIFHFEFHDADKAVVYWLQGATAGHAKSQEKLALCYGLGYGRLQADPRQAKKWTLRAAAQRQPLSMYIAGLWLLEAGLDAIKTKKDYASETLKGFEYIHLAAKAGHPAAN